MGNDLYFHKYQDIVEIDLEEQLNNAKKIIEVCSTTEIEQLITTVGALFYNNQAHSLKPVPTVLASVFDKV